MSMTLYSYNFSHHVSENFLLIFTPLKRNTRRILFLYRKKFENGKEMMANQLLKDNGLEI